MAFRSILRKKYIPTNLKDIVGNEKMQSQKNMVPEILGCPKNAIQKRGCNIFCNPEFPLHRFSGLHVFATLKFRYLFGGGTS